MSVASLCIQNKPFKRRNFLSFSRMKGTFCLNIYNSFKDITLLHRNGSGLPIFGNPVVCVFHKASETRLSPGLSAGAIEQQKVAR